MTKFALRGLLGRKLRTALTALAIVLGVAMISGTFVLTDSIDGAFDKIFTDIRQGSSAVISGRSAFDLTEGSGVNEPSFDESVLVDVRRLPSVAEAEGSVNSESTELIGDDGKVIQFGLGGAPHLGFSIANPESRFNPLSLVSARGRSRRGRDRQGDRRAGGLRARRRDRRPGRRPVQRFRIAGIIQFSSGLTIGGATLAGFDLRPRRSSSGSGASWTRSPSRPRRTPPTTARSGDRRAPPARCAGEDGRGRSSPTPRTRTSSSRSLHLPPRVRVHRPFVGSFVIANSLSITIAQRTRELATVRMLGASRRQVSARSSSRRSSSESLPR